MNELINMGLHLSIGSRREFNVPARKLYDRIADLTHLYIMNEGTNYDTAYKCCQRRCSRNSVDAR